jgi:hypothetical protein
MIIVKEMNEERNKMTFHERVVKLIEESEATEKYLKERRIELVRKNREDEKNLKEEEKKTTNRIKKK